MVYQLNLTRLVKNYLRKGRRPGAKEIKCNMFCLFF